MAKVLYVTGVRHCGSTMFEAVVGGAPHAQSLGEVWGFFRYATVRAACVCGEPPAECSFCLNTRAALGRESDARDLDALNRIARQAGSLRWIWQRSAQRTAYVRAVDDLYDAAAEAASADVLIDSSKNTQRLAALAAESRHELYVVHLIRDPRGFIRSEETDAAFAGTVTHPRRSVVSWGLKNEVMAYVCRTKIDPARTLRLHYEDLILHTHEALEAVGTMVGLDVTGLADRALAQGIQRGHLYEPHRYSDYRVTRLDPKRLENQRLSAEANTQFWREGGFIAGRWGYDREQSYFNSFDARPKL